MKVVVGDSCGLFKIIDVTQGSVCTHVSDIAREREIRAIEFTGKHSPQERAPCEAEQELTLGRRNGVVQAFQLPDLRNLASLGEKLSLRPIRQCRIGEPVVSIQSLAHVSDLGDDILAVGRDGACIVARWTDEWNVTKDDSTDVKSESEYSNDSESTEIDEEPTTALHLVKSHELRKRYKRQPWEKEEARLVPLHESLYKPLNYKQRPGAPPSKSIRMTSRPSTELAKPEVETTERPFWLSAAYRLPAPIETAVVDARTTDTARLMFGGHENDLKIVNLSQGSTMFSAKNAKPNTLGLRPEVHVRACAFLGAIHENLVCYGNSAGRVRIFDVGAQSRPILEFQGTHEQKPVASIATRPVSVHTFGDGGMELKPRKTGCDNQGLCVGDTLGMLYFFDIRRTEEPYSKKQEDPFKPTTKRQKLQKKMHAEDKAVGDVTLRAESSSITAKLRRTMQGVSGSLEAAAVHENGRYVVCAGLGKKIHVFNIHKRQCVANLYVKQNVTSMLLSTEDVSEEP